MSELMGDWTPDPKLEQAVALWRRYYDDCERYDRTVCSGMRNGSAVPVTSDEFGLINRHASERHRELHHGLAEAGIPREVAKAAQDIALREHDQALRSQEPTP